jgi:acyl-CoA thioesterase YciA
MTMEETDPLPDRQPTLRLLATSANTNASGDIFGGWVMSQVDIAGSIAAYRRAGGRVVTVAVNSFQFRKPVYVGDLISCYAAVTRVGRTSITVDVEVYAERDRGQVQCIKVTEATLTYVAVDSERRPREVK